MTDDALTARGLTDESSGNAADGLPLFEELVRRHSDSATNQEGLAVCLYVTAKLNPDGVAGAAQWKDAQDALAKAVALGDKSEMLGMTQEVLRGAYEPPVKAEQGSAEEEFAKAEGLFSHGDVEGALGAYASAYHLNPNLYEAALYAGDMLFRLHREREAYPWFAKAVVIDPNRETAYRYWADALNQAGDQDGARLKAVAALVAEPYSELSIKGLTRWAEVNGYVLVQQNNTLPAAPTQSMKDGKTQTNIVFAPDSDKDPEASIWLGFQMQRSLYRSETFAKDHPNETQPRDSLPELETAIRLALKVRLELKSKRTDPQLELLAKLDKQGLLDAWIFFAAPDEGIMQDYPVYRAGHKVQMETYVNQYILRKSAAPNAN